ncbi:MAG: VWA domain-containing protein [Atopobiaceae bacterium]|nr:VWA domain-containing protein [Atopobiaceae bacterium]
MRTKTLRKFLCAVVAATLSLVMLPLALARAEGGSAPANNRFNVVMVLDASGSMKTTDPDGLRFEAINQFTNLLANSGNELGGVVFTTAVEAQQDLAPVKSQADKRAVVDKLASVEARGDTNIGAGLDTAVNMIKKDGDKNLPSVILLLSDGNTDLPNADDLKASLDKKAESVQAARDNKIKIYSVCLNADNTADISEMQQISGATGGEFAEVKKAEDLQDVFNTFYNLIYGTSTVSIGDGKFSADGKLETTFDVPGIGVEEINIVIYGKAKSFTVTRPDGSASTPEAVESNTFTLLKIADVVPGTWKLVTEGVPGDAVKINMVFNSDLGVESELQPAEGPINPNDPLTVRAFLTAGKAGRAKTDQYVGYEAALEVLDSFNAPVESVPMKLEGDHFEVAHKLPEGAYNFRVHVTGNHLDRTSDIIGSMAVSSKASTEAEKNNTAPVPVANPVEETVMIWPFKDNSLTIDLGKLATDEQGDALQYKVISSSFMDGDYTVDGNKLTLSKFSMSKGGFTVRAVDSLGKYCDVEIVVTSHNVGLMALIGIGVAAIVAIIVLIILFRIALRKPFRGEITVESAVDGVHSAPKTVKGSRGRLPLSRFELSPTGLDYVKSYFQATGDRYVLLRTNNPVSCNGNSTKEVRIDSGAPVVVVVEPGKTLNIRFESVMRAGTGGAGGFGGGVKHTQGAQNRSAGGFGGGAGRMNQQGSQKSGGGFGGGQGAQRRPPRRPGT